MAFFFLISEVLHMEDFITIVLVVTAIILGTYGIEYVYKNRLKW